MYVLFGPFAVQWYIERLGGMFRPEKTYVDFQVSGPFNQYLRAAWTLNNINVSTLFSDWLHVAVQYRALDRAGNITDESDMLEPYHLWWMTGPVRTEILPNFEGQTVSVYTLDSAMRWRIKRGFDPQVQSGPFPRYAYRLWIAERAGEKGYAGPYLPFDRLIGWQGWVSGPPAFSTIIQEINTNDDFYGHYFLLAVIAVDEAGNLEAWPYDELNMVGDSVEVLAGSGDNWVRFLVPPPTTGIDTLLDSAYFHGTAEVGSGCDAVIEQPPKGVGFAASYTVKVIDVPDGIEEVSVNWQLEKNGQTVASDTQSLVNGDREVLVTPDMNYLTGDRGTVVDYVFRAWGQYEDGGVTFKDSTPVNCRVKVVPDLTDYIEQRGAPDDQPVKSYVAQ